MGLGYATEVIGPFHVTITYGQNSNKSFPLVLPDDAYCKDLPVYPFTYGLPFWGMLKVTRSYWEFPSSMIRLLL